MSKAGWYCVCKSTLVPKWRPKPNPEKGVAESRLTLSDIKKLDPDALAIQISEKIRCDFRGHLNSAQQFDWRSRLGVFAPCGGEIRLTKVESAEDA
jgi:hypothetical protein